MNPAQDDPLGAMAALERRYDGPVPEILRRAALASGPVRLAASDTASRSALIDRLAQQARDSLARRRRAGGDPGAVAPCPVANDLLSFRSAGLTLFAERDCRPRL